MNGSPWAVQSPSASTDLITDGQRTAATDTEHGGVTRRGYPQPALTHDQPDARQRKNSEPNTLDNAWWLDTVLPRLSLHRVAH